MDDAPSGPDSLATPASQRGDVEDRRVRRLVHRRDQVAVELPVAQRRRLVGAAAGAGHAPLGRHRVPRQHDTAAEDVDDVAAAPVLHQAHDVV
ncbi:MAG: hypothetical protein ACK559_37755, partial [bacterium]